MITPFTISYIALWILVIVQALILLGLVRMVVQLQQSGAVAGAGMTAGEEAPDFSTVDLSGAPIRSTDYAGRLRALLFVSSNCPACTTVLENDMRYLNYKSQNNLLVICQGGREACAQLAEEHSLDIPVVADEDDEIMRLYRVASVPTTVLINAEDRIQSYGQPQHEELEAAFEGTLEAEVQGVSEDGHRKHDDTARSREQAPGLEPG